MKIVQLNFSPQKGTIEKDVLALHLVAGQGIQDDEHFGMRTGKQVSFIWKKTLESLDEKGWEGFCNRRFVANIVVENKPDVTIDLGQEVHIGACVLRVTARGKDCYAWCPIFQQIGQSCNANEDIFFAKVVLGGVVEKGDEIKYNAHSV